MTQENDKDSRIALFLVFTLIGLIVAGVLWFATAGALKRNKAVAPPPVVQPQATHASVGPGSAPGTRASVSPGSAPVAAAGNIPRVELTGSMATFLFAQDSAAAPGSAQAEPILAPLLERLRAGGKLHILPFNGTQSQTAANALLPKQRGHQVYELLRSLGVPASQLLLAEVQSDPLSADWLQAQRVEVVVLPQPAPASAVSPATPVAPPAPTPVNPVPAPIAEVQTPSPVAQPMAQPNSAAQDGPRVAVEGGVVKFYFGVASDELANGAAQALAEVVAAVAAGQSAVISGYTDPTGNAAFNEELAKKRAQAVQRTLLELGVPQERITLEKPQSHTGSGDNAEARRVEVRLAP
ncbi:OmpA family protein [Vandammella animalimorsus]|uniref:OmpA family protein n=1 Tax=Vandammella animalimorsus TaxID=2029117 RepID=UPI001EED7E73|nr:OmpA family protein [Vandammella animalimorsus]